MLSVSHLPMRRLLRTTSSLSAWFSRFMAPATLPKGRSARRAFCTHSAGTLPCWAMRASSSKDSPIQALSDSRPSLFTGVAMHTRFFRGDVRLGALEVLAVFAPAPAGGCAPADSAAHSTASRPPTQ